MDRESADIYNPKVIRSTMGSVYRVPFLYVDELGGTVREFKGDGLRLYAAHLDGKHAYDREDYRGACGFLVGNEAKGLRRETADLADAWVRIPMKGNVESLNAAVASALLMFDGICIIVYNSCKKTVAVQGLSELLQKTPAIRRKKEGFHGVGILDHIVCNPGRRGGGDYGADYGVVCRRGFGGFLCGQGGP